MSDTVVRVENLSKKYIIGHQKQESYTTLRDSIANGAKGLLKPFQRGKSQVADPNSEDFWALKDVSFEIKQGDRVGIIGRNGAGKSTLLKILSRIVEPTSGQIKIKGRVASLLEVGTGFHPELTGRENISLNGAILGMSQAEISRKFDEIVAFAEVEKFLDTPVKRYSSGMYVRLAFAVAAHLEPEILIVDEVLAVGDVAFQKKCMGKMKDVGSEGRTIVFVSHNMGSIVSLCDTAVFMQQGRVREIGEVNKVSNIYLSEFLSSEGEDLAQLRPNGMGGQILFSEIKLVSGIENNLRFGEDIDISLIIKSRIDIDNLAIGISFFNNSGNCIGSVLPESIFSARADDEVCVHIKVSNINLCPGNYHASVGLTQKFTEIVFDSIYGRPNFQVLPIPPGTLRAPSNWHSSLGNIYFTESELIVVTKKQE